MLRCVLLCVVLLLAACQPREPLSPPPSAGAQPPASSLPPLPQLLADADRAAAAWQDGARVAEIALRLADGSPELARLTYVAPHADRLLVQEVSASGTTQERPTLATLSLPPLDQQAVDALPAFPPDAQSPAALLQASESSLSACAQGAAASHVVYSSGAPYTWDGQHWTEPLQWTVDVVASDEDGPAQAVVTVDPVSGSVLQECARVEP